MRIELQAKTLREPYLRSAFKTNIFSNIFKTMYDIIMVRNLSAKIIILNQYMVKLRNKNYLNRICIKPTYCDKIS